MVVGIGIEITIIQEKLVRSKSGMDEALKDSMQVGKKEQGKLDEYGYVFDETSRVLLMLARQIGIYATHANSI